MKKLLVIAATLAAISSLKAQEDVDFSVSLGYESSYVFRGFKLADESMTASVEAAFGDAYLGMWTNQPIVKGFDNEFDFYGGMAFDLAEGLSAAFGGTLYYYPESGSGSDTFELFADFAFDTELSPGVAFYYDLDLEALTIEGYIGHSFEMDEKSSFDVAAFYGWVDGDGFDYSYYGASADIVYSLGDTASASIGVRYSNGSDGPDDETWFGGSISTGW
ncbi:MAG: hypothetical protein KJT03_00920 [Verrucomicrobiae bacterium]|nr:hypothetical protein [Verrucomicrobiae bacterium]